MTDKDFLSQFSGTDKKPDSFKEEERIPVQKEKKPFNPLYVIIPVAVLLIAGFLVWFFLLRPNIPVEDFTGLTKEDVAAWVRQQGIETSGIIFREEYNFEAENGKIISQDPLTGKVTKNAKISFVVSKGPDPDESISVPDLKNMTRSEIESWISINKLLSTKLSTSFNEEYEEGKVISIDYSGCDEDSFTRGCSLKINISKGAKPAEEITMENYVGKSFEELKVWAESKGLKVSKVESYSSTVPQGTIIAHTPRVKEKIKTGDTIVASVSSGKAVYMGSFIGKSYDEVEIWQMKNGISVETKHQYNNSAKNTVVAQYPSAGAVVSDVASVTVSKGNPDIREFTGSTVDDLQQWIDMVNDEGAGLHIGNVSYEINDTVPVGNIISLPDSVVTGGSINIVVSRGKNIWLTEYKNPETSEIIATWDDMVINPGNYNEETVRGYCADAGVSFVVSYAKSTTIEPNHMISIKRSDNEPLCINSYIAEDVVIQIVICEEKVSE